jgi:hypothetical protein
VHGTIIWKMSSPDGTEQKKEQWSIGLKTKRPTLTSFRHFPTTSNSNYGENGQDEADDGSSLNILERHGDSTSNNSSKSTGDSEEYFQSQTKSASK